MKKEEGIVTVTEQARISSQESLVFYRCLRDCLLEPGRLALATLIARSGSGPREAGAAMIIAAGGKTTGTVGGGQLEARVVALAKEVIREGGSAVCAISLSAKEAANSGMICGGRVEVLVEALEGKDPACLTLLNRFLDLSVARDPALLIRSIRPDVDEEVSRTVSSPSDPQAGDGRFSSGAIRVRTGWGGLQGHDFYAGSLDMTNVAPAQLKQNVPSEASLLELGPIRYFYLPMKEPITVQIVGAGHVGQALADLCPLVGFRTVIIDDRADFANRNRFPAAADIRVVSSLENCFPGLDVTKNTYVVIVTRGHAFDRSVLAQALRTGAGYIGMIGSKTKRDALYAKLLDEGFTSDDLSRVYSPIGLAIGAKTPAEIAVSIVAQMIAVRAGQAGD